MSRPTTTTDLVKRLQSEVISKKERIALQALATEMFEVFREEKLLRLGHEAAALAVVASPERYRELLWAFANAIIEGTTDDNVLHPVLCKSLVHVLRCSIPRDTADPSTKVDSRLGTVLSSLKRRLESAVAQGDPNAEYQLVSTLGSVLHAMYDVQMVGIDRETVQKPLLDTLDTLSKDREIRLAQAATYAYEALRCLPDSEGPYKILLLKLVDVVGAVSKIAGAVATMDASKLFDGAVGLADVPDLVSAMVDVVKSISEAVGSLDAAKDVVSKQRKPKSWYVALRYGDMLIQNRAFAILKLFLDKVPCRQDIDFLCGLSAQLEQMWVQAAADDGAQARATRDHVQAVFASLPQPKSRSDPLHGVIGGASDNKKRWAAWKDAVARTMRSHTPQPNNDNKTKDYADTLHCYTVTFGSLPTGLLSKAWLRCTQAQRFYADTRLRKHYLAHDEYLLKIERLSGAWLPMQDCYINLKMIKTSKSNTSNETVPLHSLFDPCICKDGAMRVPRRLLIYGAAGVGKTTLCKKVVYELTRSPVSPEFQSWTAAYDRVIWLPLRNLTSHDPGKKYTLLDLFQAEYMHALQDGEVFARVLHDHCTASSDDDAKSSRTLFLLDGLDEVSQYLDANHRAAKFLLSLLSQPDVIITSRPGVRIPNRMRIPPLDCELETTGFNDYQVQQYVRHSLSDRQRVEAFLRFLHRHRLLSELVKIPLLLDALCYIWQDNNPNDNPNDNPDDDNPDNDNHATEAAQSIKTATAIYRAIEDKLWCKDIPRLEKYGPRGRITEDMVRGLRIREQIRELVHVEAAFLQQMAFSGLVSETVYFNERHCDNVLRHMDAPCLSGSVDDVLLHVSCLRTLQPSIASLDSMATTDRHRTYHFVHSTFQEYFAAQYFVGCWTAGTALAFVVSKDSARHVMGTDRFLAAHKYDARYSRFWRFVAGLLHNETDAPDTASLGRFFDALESEPRDIVGHEHQALVVQCLVEADPAQDMALFDAHRSRLKEWVAYDFDQWQTLRVLSLFSFPELISGPIVQDETGTITLSETRTLELLQSNFLREVPPDLCIIDASGRMPLATCKLLRKQPFLPVHVLQAITYRLRHSPIDRSHHSLDVLGQHLGDALPLILDCLRHTTGFVRANAATAFAGIACDRAALPPEAVAALVRCCTSDVFEGAACNAMVALCNVRPFPQDAIVVICDKLHDEKDSVRRAAAEAKYSWKLPAGFWIQRPTSGRRQ
ncbi:hypothetical protein HMPREF1624_01549 [Sporothrix schenckii ATCC 58251]|uniref:NACHT domain-containing protein n=1 Tax=Sporothrix schenckii (strain ATCC 58251 / de Perez 2211183) TaxID=1391915 RepID=U7Q5X2_SPOS1|nr:hypothetical protein HMPREF1624_01549 [Sporothrix schenckii ATCC 58251]